MVLVLVCRACRGEGEVKADPMKLRQGTIWNINISTYQLQLDRLD